MLDYVYSLNFNLTLEVVWKKKRKKKGGIKLLKCIMGLNLLVNKLIHKNKTKIKLKRKWDLIDG